MGSRARAGCVSGLAAKTSRAMLRTVGRGVDRGQVGSHALPTNSPATATTRYLGRLGRGPVQIIPNLRGGGSRTAGSECRTQAARARRPRRPAPSCRSRHARARPAVRIELWACAHALTELVRWLVTEVQRRLRFRQRRPATGWPGLPLPQPSVIVWRSDSDGEQRRARTAELEAAGCPWDLSAGAPAEPGDVPSPGSGRNEMSHRSGLPCLKRCSRNARAGEIERSAAYC